MKLLFFKLAAIAAGVVFAVAALLGGTYWYLNRPASEKPWNETALVADGPPGFGPEGEDHVSLTYVVLNSTNKDFIAESETSFRLMFVTEGGALIGPMNEKDAISVTMPIFVPARTKGNVRIYLKYPAKNETKLSDDEFHELLRGRLKKTFNRGSGFALFDESRRFRINLPPVAAEKPKNK